MVPLYTQEEFEASKSHGTLPLKCKGCGERFYRTKRDIQISRRSRSDGKSGTMEFCGLSCLGNHRRLAVEVSCSQCRVSFSKSSAQIRKTEHHFCSQSCAAKYHNSHKRTGTRRSKLEVWLEAQLTTSYPTLKFDFNKTDAIEAELDIYIPSLKLAFELNGIFHFEPVFGQGKLDRIQSNDQRKFAACAERGISLCVLDTSRVSYFKERTANPFLEIIQRHIDQAISPGISSS